MNKRNFISPIFILNTIGSILHNNERYRFVQIVCNRRPLLIPDFSNTEKIASGHCHHIDGICDVIYKTSKRQGLLL